MSLSVARACYRALLCVCPPGVRREHGRDMEEVFLFCLAAETRRRSWFARPLLRWRAAADLVRFAASAWLDRGRGPARPPRRRPLERTVHIMRTILQDVRFGARLLVKDRTFAAAALLTLAVCIGANAAIFSVVRSVILSPLPVPESDRLVLMYNSYPHAGAPQVSTGVPDYFDRVRELTAFEEQALFRRAKSRTNRGTATTGR